MLKTIWLILGLSLVVGCGRHSVSTSSNPDLDSTHYTVSTEVGAGGSGIYCTDKQGRKTSFETMDVYEARKRNMGPELGGPELSVEAKVEIALKRLERLSPQRAQRYRQRIKEILDPKNFFHRGYLPHIGDEDPANLEEGCVPLQIATRRKPIFENDTEFLIDQNLYNQLDGNDNRAVLLMHEAGFDEAGKKFGHTTSRMVRGFISQFFSSRIEHFSFRQFLEFLGNKVDFKTTDFAGVEIPTKIFSNDGIIYATYLYGDNDVSSVRWSAFEGEKGSSRSFPYQNGELFLMGSPQQAAFENGKLVAITGHLSSDRVFSDRGNKLDIGLESKFSNSLTTFDDRGQIQLLTVLVGSELKMRAQASLKKVEKMSCVSLDNQGFAEVITEGDVCLIKDSKRKLPAHWKD